MTWEPITEAEVERIRAAYHRHSEPVMPEWAEYVEENDLAPDRGAILKLAKV